MNLYGDGRKRGEGRGRGDRQKEKDIPENLHLCATSISKNGKLLVILSSAVKGKSSQFCNQEIINLGTSVIQHKVNMLRVEGWKREPEITFLLKTVPLFCLVQTRLNQRELFVLYGSRGGLQFEALP